MLLGLAVKELVIGGLSVLGVGMGTCNSVSIHKTKKRVSSCENAINEIASMKESIQRMEAKLQESKMQNSQPKTSQTQEEKIIRDNLEKSEKLVEELKSVNKETKEINKKSIEIPNKMDDDFKEKLVSNVSNINKKLDEMIKNNQVLMKDGDIYTEKINRIDMLIGKLESEFDIDDEIKRDINDMKTKLNTIIISLDDFMKDPDPNKDIFSDSSIGDDIDALINDVNNKKAKTKANK